MKYSKMEWLAIFLFPFILQFSGIEGARYDIDDAAGIVSIVLLIFAIIVCIFSLIFFFYIVYELWHGNFGRRNRRSVSRERFVINEQVDGHQSTLNTKPVHSYRNEVAAAEEAREVEKTALEETVVEEGLKSEEVIVTQAPSTEQAEMETQELVVVFDDNDDVIDVLTHIT